MDDHEAVNVYEIAQRPDPGDPSAPDYPVLRMACVGVARKLWRQRTAPVTSHAVPRARRVSVTNLAAIQRL